MITNWRNWCRLCAKFSDGGVDLFLKLESVSDLSQVIQTHFNLSITPYDGGPTKICKTCLQFLVDVKNFADQCLKTDLMFSELMYGRIQTDLVPDETEMFSIRTKFGVDGGSIKFEESTLSDSIDVDSDEDKRVLKVDQCTDTDDLLYGIVNVKQEIESTPHFQITTVSGRSKRNRRPQKYACDDDDEDEGLVTMKHEQDINKSEDVSVVSMKGGNDDDDDDDDYHYDNEERLDESNIDDGHDEELEEEEDEEDEDEEADDGDGDEYIVNEDGIENIKTIRKRKTRTIGDIKCEHCDRSFTRSQSYKSHLKTKHGEGTDTDLYFCASCPRRFSTQRSLTRHESIHLPESLKMVHPCSFCDKKFTKAVNVKAHIRSIHRGERPFTCEKCGKSFGTKGALKDHAVTHSEERPYQCSYCPKKLKNLSRLRTHEDIHTDTVYVCPHCGLQLNTKRTLKMHMVVHSDDKKYKCQYCGNEYKRSKALKNHLILHTGLRPYACPFCDKTFANGSNCRSHKKKAHPAELAAAEATGEKYRVTNIPKLEHLQPKNLQNFDQKTQIDIANQLQLLPQEVPTEMISINSPHSNIIQELSPHTPQQSSPQTPQIIEIASPHSIAL